MSVYLTFFSIFLGLILTAMADFMLSKSVTVFQKIFIVPAYFLTLIRYYHGNVLFYALEFKAKRKQSLFGVVIMAHFFVVCIEFLLLYIIAKQIGNISNVLIGLIVLFAIDCVWLFISSTKASIPETKKPSWTEAIINSFLFVIVLFLFFSKLSNTCKIVLLSLSLVIGTIISYYSQRSFFFGEKAKELNI